MIRRLLQILLFIVLLIIGYGVIRIAPLQNTEIPAETATPVPTYTQAAPAESATAPEAAATSTPGEQPAPPQATKPHGLFYAFVVPIIVFGLPWIVSQLIIIRYVQPRGVDLTQVRIKAQDGLFIEAAVSMTARRTLTLASTRMT